MRIKIFLMLLSCIMLTTVFPNLSQAEDNNLRDIKGLWAEKEINYLYSEGIINGFPDGSFNPSQSVTRYQAASMLITALDIPITKKTDTIFKDISKTSPRYAIAATVHELGLMRGSNSNFRPGEPVTRAQMATILTRAFQLERNHNFYFTDIQPDFWNFTEVSALAKSGITGGKGDKTFAPSEATSRAHFSVFLYRAMNENRMPTSPLAGEYGNIVEIEDNLISTSNDIYLYDTNKDSIPFERYLFEDIDLGIGKLKGLLLPLQVVGDKVLFKVGTENGMKLISYKEGQFELESNEAFADMYFLDNKIYYVEDFKLIEKSGNTEKVLITLPDSGIFYRPYFVDFSGSKIYYHDKSKVYSYDLLNGDKKVLYNGKAQRIDVFQGNLVILLNPYGSIVSDLKGKIIRINKLGTFSTEHTNGLNISDAADGGVHHIPRK